MQHPSVWGEIYFDLTPDREIDLDYFIRKAGVTSKEALMQLAAELD